MLHSVKLKTLSNLDSGLTENFYLENVESFVQFFTKEDYKCPETGHLLKIVHPNNKEYVHVSTSGWCSSCSNWKHHTCFDLPDTTPASDYRGFLKCKTCLRE